MNKEAIYAQKGFYLGCILSVLLILAGLISTPASAQSGIGSIEGTVADSTGAVVPGAAIHVVNLATQTAANTKSNSVGFFQVPGLVTGTYTVSVSAPGMKTYETSIELLVAQTAVINPMLAVGAQSQQVIVNADQVQLTTNDSPSISSTLENQRINQLPMNTREITTTLTATTPGLDNNGQSMNGMAPEALKYTIDGAETNNMNAGTVNAYVLTQLLDPDSIQEVHIESSNGSAQYASPGTVVMSSRSGTNHLHGTMFETARNNSFGVAKPRQAVADYVAPQLIRNEFGASAGGPVIIPHVYHGRGKTFWFFAYERYSNAAQTPGLASVPTYGTPGNSGVGSGMNNGDFSSLVSAKGVTQVLYNPATTASSNSCAATGGKNTYCRTPFANNQIPVTSESPFAKIYYQMMPKPNIANVTNPTIQNNLSYNAPTYQVVAQETARVDHEFNEDNRGFLRFTQNRSPVNISNSGPLNLPVTGIAAGAALGYANNNSAANSGILDYTHVFSPTFFAETNYSMQWFTENKVSGVNPNIDYESMLGLPNNFGEAGFPAVSGLIEPLQSSQNANNGLHQIVTILGENLTKIVGRNQIYFGGRFYHARATTKLAGLADGVPNGVFSTAVYQTSSGGNYKAVTNTGYADASFFLGSPSSYKINLEPQNPHFHVNEFDAYIQDTFHFSKKLTFNLGLRYEAHPATWTKFGLANSFDLKNDAMVLAATPAQLISEGYTTQAIITNDENIGVKFETPQQAGVPANTLQNNYDLNFLPRLGVAWMPFHTGTIIRGGFGQYLYGQPLADYVNRPALNNPLTTTVTQSYLTAAQAIDALPDEQLRYNAPVQFGVMGTSSANAVNTNVTNAILPGIALFSSDPNWKPTVVNEANFTIEQPLPGRSVLRATYLNSHTANLDVDDGVNTSLTDYEYEMAYGVLPPIGGTSVIGTPQQNTYSTTAEGPYDQATWGVLKYHTKAGWANYNAVQLNYERLYHHGFAYQISYVYGKQMSMGGDTADDSGSNGDQIEAPDADYPGVLGTLGQMSLLPGSSTPYAGVAPPARPSGTPVWQDYHAMDRYQGYMLDPSHPIMDIKFNGIYDLPVGKGKWLLTNSPRWLDEIVGGFQIAGLGTVYSRVFQPGTGNNGPVSPIQVNKRNVPVVDCRSGACVKGYEWFNGYLSPLVIGANCASTPACVTGVPSSYQPFQTPINNTPTVNGVANPYFGDNDVNVTLTGNPTPVTLAYDTGPNGSNYTSRTYLKGPGNWNADLSLFKVFPIREQMNLRVNFDAFNAFNHQGNPLPGTADGIETFLTSVNTARQLQITARFSF